MLYNFNRFIKEGEEAGVVNFYKCFMIFGGVAYLLRSNSIQLFLTTSSSPGDFCCDLFI